MADLYYNNIAGDGDWGNLANWWQDSGFSNPATALPDATSGVYIYGNITQNTATGGNCPCLQAEFHDSTFANGLTLQTTGLVNIFGSSVFAGAMTDGASIHDSSYFDTTANVAGDAVFRDASYNLGTIQGNATVYCDVGFHAPIGGTVEGSVTYVGLANSVYYTNASGDGTWENLTNWFNPATGANPTEVPWTDTDGSTSAINLIDATGGAGVTINSDIDPNGDVTGTCDIANITNSFGNNYGIYGGTFTGDNFNNQGPIGGGTFTGDNFTNNGPIFGGGTFTGDNFTNGIVGQIASGTFTGDNFTNSFSNYNGIGGGTFTGDNFTNGGEIAGGTFEIDGFQNYGTIQYNSISITLDGTPYTGVWENQVWSNGSWVYALIIYYTNASGDGTWENLSNWNSAPDNSGSNPTEVPWTDTDGSTSASNLYDATGGAGVSINSTIDPNGDVSGTCDIANIALYAPIYGGTFTGDNFTNNGSIYGGTFTGNNFTNNGPIFGGTFTGTGYTNYRNCQNASFGNNFANQNGGVVANCYFGNGFSSWDIAECYFASDGTFTQGQTNYTYNDGFAAIAYPTPSGGGNSTIARLLNLPWFINI
jgi:hypothetical protein